MPPEASGIADYSALLLPALRRHVDVDGREARNEAAASRCRPLLFTISATIRMRTAGSSMRCGARRGSSSCTTSSSTTSSRGSRSAAATATAYLDAMEREHGVVGRLLGHGVLDKRLPPLWEARPEEFPLAGEVLALATGLIVHSRYVDERARAAGFERPDRESAASRRGPIRRSRRPRSRATPLFGAFGNVNASKRVPQLLEAFARVRAEHPGARLLLVGATSPGFDLERRLQRLGLDGDGIVREGYVDEPRLWALMAACDVHVNLRSPTMGETSGTAIRGADARASRSSSSTSAGSPSCRTSVALKVPVGDSEVDDLAAALRLLAERAGCPGGDGRAPRGCSAGSEHDLERVAELQAAAFEQHRRRRERLRRGARAT